MELLLSSHGSSGEATEWLTEAIWMRTSCTPSLKPCNSCGTFAPPQLRRATEVPRVPVPEATHSFVQECVASGTSKPMMMTPCHLATIWLTLGAVRADQPLPPTDFQVSKNIVVSAEAARRADRWRRALSFSMCSHEENSTSGS